jgi:hypothetical protein
MRIFVLTAGTGAVLSSSDTMDATNSFRAQDTTYKA